MEILALSLNHRVTPLGVREEIVFSQAEGEAFLGQIRDRALAEEVLLLSTCNRTEVYTIYDFDPELERRGLILDLLREERGFEALERPRNYFVARNEEAVRHLFRVAAGLESQLLGESQILGQVKSSLAWARAAGTNGRLLNRLWERALRVGKRVRSETAIGEGALSASYAALELARKIFGDLRDRHVLVVGTGEIGVLTLQNLEGVAAASLTVMNRTRSHADELAGRFGGKVRDFSELSAALAETDLVISSTGSPEPLIRYEEMKKIRQRRGGDRPLLVIDLAVPRDFEERCGNLDQVFLKNLDDLEEIVRGNISERRKEMPRANEIIDRELASFSDWLRALDVEPTVRKLRELFHSIRREELQEARGSLDEESYQVLERLTRHLVNRLLHTPTENLRRHLGLRDHKLAAVVHELLTTEIPHPKEEERPAEPPPERDEEN